jgi:glycosyltransferase involved in cell wall biosynthesis
MRVALFPSSVEMVGVATHVLNLARLLKQADMLDVVICPQEGWLTKKLIEENLPHYMLKSSPEYSHSAYSNLTLFLFLRSKKSLQAVHVHGRFPLFTSLLSMLLLKNIDFVVTVHQFCDTARAGSLGWMNRLETYIWKHLVKKICCVSEPLKAEVLSRVGIRHMDKVNVISNWIYPIEYYYAPEKETTHKEENDGIRIVAIGRLSQEKGFDVLIEAIHILEKEGIDVRCDIFGEGPERVKLASQIQNHRLNNRVKLQGNHASIRRLLSKYDLLAVPSRRESFGLVVLEAYDAGIPIVASNTPGLNYTVKDKKTGLLFESGNAESLAHQITVLVTNPELAASLTIDGKALLAREYLPNMNLLCQYRHFYGVEDEKN